MVRSRRSKNTCQHDTVSSNRVTHLNPHVHTHTRINTHVYREERATCMHMYDITQRDKDRVGRRQRQRESASYTHDARLPSYADVGTESDAHTITKDIILAAILSPQLI